ncbi:HdeD family acid-resistance protein [Celeribacter indicus]|uniref:HdeD protein n=1 Tax=Celeribacter indicus TaxID=1208324 RepID=A0A0B5DU75_9RHOB|nr:DUF308 domain-containing protein [Celeribacter indicus]AJE44780.1 hypothetical protein P73_0065 [Celeribacter indicus]SDX46807.1 Uncharacterized membrane protein HdeD, DUF308 family [Celeribacter indicus]
MRPWQIWVLIGLVCLIFGALALGNVVAASLAITILLGIFFTIAGIVQLWATFKGFAHEHRWISILWGLLSLAIGISFIADPIGGTISLTLLVTSLLIASGVVRLVMAWQIRQTGYFWTMLFSGAISVLLGAYIAANFATASLALLGLFFGIELLIDGFALIGLGLYLRAHRS